MRNAYIVLIVAAVAASGFVLSGCITDDSVPSHPRTAAPFAADPKAQDNAFNRSLEAPKQDVPGATGKEFPGQSNAAPKGDRTVAMLDDTTTQPNAATPATPAVTPVTPVVPAETAPPQPTGWDIIGNYHGPVSNYDRDIYNDGPIPHLPNVPGTVPMTGSTPVPGTGWAIDNSWGQVLPLENYHHRAWPETKGEYLTANVNNNPVYYFNIQQQLPVPQTTGNYIGDWESNLYEVPWFYLNTAALPVLMVLEPPLAKRSTDIFSSDPNYRGYLPPTGDAVPTPAPGEMRWEYPFLNPDGSVKEKYEATTQPATAP